MVDTQAVAFYSISLTIAGLISILPNILIEAFRPDIMEYKINNETLYQRRLGQLYAIIFWSCMVYGVLIMIFSKPIIGLLYGPKYLPAVPSLSLVVWYTSFSYFGAINNVYMVAEEKTKWVIISTFVGASCNVLLNWLFIPTWKICGAAMATLLTQIMTNFVMMFLIKDLRKGFKIMYRAIVFKFSI